MQVQFCYSKSDKWCAKTASSTKDGAYENRSTIEMSYPKRVRCFRKTPARQIAIQWASHSLTRTAPIIPAGRRDWMLVSDQRQLLYSQALEAGRAPAGQTVDPLAPED